MRGYSLPEVLVAMLLVAFTALYVLALFPAVLRGLNQAHLREMATTLAASELYDWVARGQDGVTQPSFPQTRQYSERTFEVDLQELETVNGITRVRARVTWGEQSVVAETWAR